MSETLKRLFIGTGIDPLASKGELVVVSPAPTLDELTADILADHNDAERAAQTAITKCIAAGKKLRAAKKLTPHGCFEEYVARHFPFTMGCAQKYMRLALQETKLNQLIEQKRSAGLHLSMKEALKFLNKLTAETKPKPPKRKPT
jgi:hypothetical protein